MVKASHVAEGDKQWLEEEDAASEGDFQAEDAQAVGKREGDGENGFRR
jgi:hypothetical protein